MKKIYAKLYTPVIGSPFLWTNQSVSWAESGRAKQPTNSVALGKPT